ncbi:MAG: hypothetical protein ACOX1P_19445 [Thermoguttaceae bacterium]|jgi:hypothetical protein
MTNHLLERYVTLGIRLTADNGRLEIDAPDGILTPGLVDELRQHKPALLAALTIPEPAPGPPMDSAPIGPGVPVDLMPADGSWDELPEPEPCRVCGGINAWWGVWGERHCSVCEPAGQRSLLLANRAARLRGRR